MIDLTGRPVPWPPLATRLWSDCLARSAADRRLDALPPNSPGDERLRVMLAAHLGLDVDRVGITAGLRCSATIYGRLAAAARRTYVERPTFDGVPYVLRWCGATLTSHTWTELFDTELMPDSFVWLTSPARNPDGARLTGTQCAAVDRWVDLGARVVVNATYRWWDPDAARPRFADFAGSLSKLGPPGHRIGWIETNRVLDGDLPHYLGLTPPPVLQRAWALFLEDGGMSLVRPVAVGSAAAAVSAFRTAVATELERDIWTHIAGPNVLIHLAPGVSEDGACQALARSGILVGAGRSFGTPLPAIRLNFTGVDVSAAVSVARAVVATGLFGDGRLAS